MVLIPGPYDSYGENVNGVSRYNVSGSHRRVYQGGMHVGDTSMIQASIGFQACGKGYSQVIFFQDKRALDGLSSGNFEFGAEAQAAALTTAATATANTAGNRASASGGKNNANISSGGYNMAEASVAGQKFSYTPSNV